MLQGRQQDAEAQWDTACTSITTGCAKYQDRDWLLRIRRCACYAAAVAGTDIGNCQYCHACGMDERL